MDSNKYSIIEKNINKTIESLKKNNMPAYYAKTKQDIFSILEELIPENANITSGGSVTLEECNIKEFLNKDKYNYVDRDTMTPEEKSKLYTDSFGYDVYISSVNAISTDGLLINIDGNGNRVSAITFGPKKVIIIAGYNKINPSLDDAISYARNVAAPANATRLKRNTPCVKFGHCVNCSSEERICSHFVIHAKQLKKDRIHVIIVGEQLGY